MRGWLALIHRVTEAQRQLAYYERLLGLVAFFAEQEVLPFDQRAAVTLERLRQQRVRIGTMDFKVAAIALEHNALVLSGKWFHPVRRGSAHRPPWIATSIAPPPGALSPCRRLPQGMYSTLRFFPVPDAG
jgi:tRNA(fMet)-specific endonuclease VapC